MGVDIHFYITKYNKEKNIFEEIALYTAGAGKYKKVPVFIGRNYDMFDILRNKIIIDNIEFPYADIAYNSLEEKLKNTIEGYIGKEGEFTGCYDFSEVNLADLKDYVKFKCILEDFKVYYSLEQYSLKELDRYLWLLGKEYFKKKY